MEKNLILLKEVESELNRQKKEIQELFNQNIFRIEKAESYLKDLTEKEADDFKVFSPRSIESVYKDRIEKETFEKDVCEKENKSYQEKINELESMIEKLNTVIRGLSLTTEKNMGDLQIYSNGRIANQIINCVSYITLDPERAKIELTALAKKILENH